MPRANSPPAAPAPAPSEAVRRCRQDAEFLAALEDIYRRLDAAVAARGVVCRADGACCKFDAFDHKLYLSTGELALPPPSPPPAPPAAGRCPYQVGPRCTARRRRPLGCRVFFCDPGAAEWGRAACETFHGEIRALHERHALPYAYVELSAGIEAACPRQAKTGPRLSFLL